MKITVWTGILLGLLALCYLAFPYVLVHAFRYYLDEVGFELVRAEVEEIQAGSARFSVVELVPKEDARQSVSPLRKLQINNLELRYQLQELIQARLQQISVDGLQLELVSGNGSEQVREDMLHLSTPAQWLAYLPAARIEVDDVRVTWTGVEDGQHSYSVTGHARYKDSMIAGWFQLADHSGVVAKMDLSLGADAIGINIFGPEQDEVVAVTAQVQEQNGALSVAGKLQIDLGKSREMLLARLEAMNTISLLTGKADVGWRLEVPMEISAQDAWSELLRLQAQIAVTNDMVLASGDHIKAEVQADIDLAENILQWRLRAPSTVSLSGDQQPQRFRIQTQQATGRVQYTGASVMAQVEPEAHFVVELTGVSGVALSPLELRLPQGLALDFDMGGSRLNATQPLLVSIVNVRVEQDGATLVIDEAELATEKLWQEQGQWGVEGRIKATGMVAMLDGHTLPASELEGRVRFVGEQLEAQLGVATRSGNLNVRAKVMHDVGKQTGRLEAELLPTLLGKKQLLISSLYQPWPYPVELNAGVVSGLAQLDWRLPGSGKVNAAAEYRIEKTYRFKLEQLGGHYDKHTFSGLNAHGMLEDKEGLRTVEPVQVEVGKIDVGMEIESIKMGLEYRQGSVTKVTRGKVANKPVVTIHGLNAKVLGGRVTSDQIELDLARARNDFVVRLEGADVTKILETQGQEGLQGSGIIDGLLPVVLTEKGVEVRRGALQARAPGGVIRYRSGESGKSLQGVDPRVGLMMQTLENFHYTLLQSEVDYSEDGNLVMKMRLEGRNPELKAKNPVHLNLNVEQNVLSLLKSLRLADELGEKLGEAYK